MVKFVCKEKKMILGEKIFIASTFLERLKGLMFDKKLGEDFDGMLIKQCNSIHTFFMNYNIDVLFLNKKLEVIKIILLNGERLQRLGQLRQVDPSQPWFPNHLEREQ